MATISHSMGVPACGACCFAVSSSTVVPTIAPRTVDPSTNGPSNRAPNHWPNAVESVIALHTRSIGARSRTDFSIRSVLICNLPVAFNQWGRRCATDRLHELGKADALQPEVEQSRVAENLHGSRLRRAPLVDDEQQLHQRPAH